MSVFSWCLVVQLEAWSRSVESWYGRDQVKQKWGLWCRIGSISNILQLRQLSLPWVFAWPMEPTDLGWTPPWYSRWRWVQLCHFEDMYRRARLYHASGRPWTSNRCYNFFLWHQLLWSFRFLDTTSPLKWIGCRLVSIQMLGGHEWQSRQRHQKESGLLGQVEWYSGLVENSWLWNRIPWSRICQKKLCPEIDNQLTFVFIEQESPQGRLSKLIFSFDEYACMILVKRGVWEPTR